MNQLAQTLHVPCATLAQSTRPSFSIPLADLAEFSGLPEKRRNEVHFLLPLLGRIAELRQEHGLTAAVQIVAAATKQQRRGCSPVTLLRKHYAYAEAHNWRSLVAGYKGPNTQPVAFQQEIKRVAELNHRSVTEALNQLRERWAAGESIPGYGTWMEYYSNQYPERSLPKVWPRNFFPPGWHPRNLSRYGPKKSARMLIQRGLMASKKFYPSVPRDTSNLRPLELIVIDDFELDCLCVFRGDANNAPQIGRVAGLLAIDVATRKKLHWGLGQRMERNEAQPDGTMKTVRTGITRLDVQVFLHGIFSKMAGLPDYQITILCENASAAISPELELSINTLFDGRVRIERTGLIDHKTLTNGFAEKGGKPWEKSWIESAFNKLWNIMGAEEGYKGSNQRLNAPADLDGKLAMTRILLGQGERQLNLPPELLAQVRLPFPSLAALEVAFGNACALSDERTNHRYVGFSQVTEFLLEDGGEPQPFERLALLPAEKQMNVQLVERMESSRERWWRLCQTVNFNGIPAAVLAVFLLTPRRVRYQNNAITFVHQKVGYTYIDPHGTVLREVQDGTEFLAYVDFKNPEQLHITQLNGEVTGTLTRLGGARGRIDVMDKDALSEAGAMTAAIRNRDIADLRERHAARDRQLAEDQAHNATIVAGHRAATKGLSVAEKIAAAGNVQAAETASAKALQRADALDATQLF